LNKGTLENWRHICVDMQRLFAQDTPWHVVWMDRVLPQVLEIASTYPERTIFTRFLTPETKDAAKGTWRNYYEKWWMMTGDHLPAEMLELVPALQRLVPPASLFDKKIYSPWLDGRLHTALRSQAVETLVITGGETDVCVMATLLGAVDLGYRIILIEDALCSGDDQTHEASLELLRNRFSVQLELMTTDDFLRQAYG